MGLPELVHAELIKIYLSDHLIGHICRDSTEIEAREKPVKKIAKPKVVRKKGRPKKGEV